VAADSWPRCEPHEPERLCRRSVDRSPDVDVESSCELGQFVDERDVDVSERVLKQFDEFGFSAVRDGNRLVHQVEKNASTTSSDSGRSPETTFGVFSNE
jgi:pantothenate kinase